VRKFIATLSTGNDSAKQQRAFEVDEDMPDEGIVNIIREWAMSFVDWDFVEDDA